MSKRVDEDTKKAGEEDLYYVLSIAEAAAIWGVSTAVIRYHINRSNIASRKCGHTVIVPVVCMVALYGPPRVRPGRRTLDREG